ncbi:UNVERIFIED_CONTAM: hypothetical protein K2H54_046231 [Gekko kuhli]
MGLCGPGDGWGLLRLMKQREFREETQEKRKAMVRKGKCRGGCLPEILKCDWHARSRKLPGGEKMGSAHGTFPAMPRAPGNMHRAKEGMQHSHYGMA